LVELPRALRADTKARGPRLPDLLPLTSRLEAAFASQASELPEVTQDVLLVAAADDRDSAAEVLEGAGVVSASSLIPDAFVPAIDAKLVELDADTDALRFRHPLVRSAIYQAAAVPRRLSAHAALAAVVMDPDRRAWHRAASVLGTDEETATELVATARRSEQRGAIGAAISALERAAQLSGDEARRGSRLLDAADLAFQLGRHDVLLRLLREAESLDVAPIDRPRLAGSASGTRRHPGPARGASRPSSRSPIRWRATAIRPER
jgi:tetratricopeptide (TPR) repeat protein